MEFFVFYKTLLHPLPHTVPQKSLERTLWWEKACSDFVSSLLDAFKGPREKLQVTQLVGLKKSGGNSKHQLLLLLLFQ